MIGVHYDNYNSLQTNVNCKVIVSDKTFIVLKTFNFCHCYRFKNRLKYFQPEMDEN